MSSNSKAAVLGDDVGVAMTELICFDKSIGFSFFESYQSGVAHHPWYIALVTNCILTIF